MTHNGLLWFVNWSELTTVSGVIVIALGNNQHVNFCIVPFEYKVNPLSFVDSTKKGDNYL